MATGTYYKATSQGPPKFFKTIFGSGTSTDPFIEGLGLVDQFGNPLVSGLSAVQSSATGMTNVLPDFQYNLTPAAVGNGYFVVGQCDNLGRLLVNPGINNGVPNQVAISVLVTSTLILNANPNRSYLAIQNQDATNPIWIAFGNAAVANNNAFKIAATGTLFFENNFIPNTSVYGISTGGTVLTAVLEG